MQQGRGREATVPPYGSPRVPGQARVVEPCCGAPGGCAPDGGTRGEHTHSEPPAPRTAEPTAARTAEPPAPRTAEPPAPRTAGSPAPAPRAAVHRHSVRGQILAALRTALVDGELVPGEVYSAPALAERFGVSATPVREAMQQLSIEGAVEVVPNRGFRVTERSPRELAELAEVRAMIEVPVMLRLARTVPAARWAELRPLAEATTEAAATGDRAGYAECDRSFHRALLALAGNQQLVQVADDLHRRAQWPLTAAPVARRGDLVADAAEHLALLDALCAQNLPVVQSLVREHFTGSAL
ncbi:FCD domain-containing protein [Streptomyces sp. NPDC001251]